MGKHPETLAMELAVEQVATSNRKSFWTKDDVVSVFLKRNKYKRDELARLGELDRETQAILRDQTGQVPKRQANAHRDRELSRLNQLAGNVMRSWLEEEYGLHRRFGAWRDEKGQWRWFEVRYSTVSFLELWRDMKEHLKERLGFTIEETDIILTLARKHQAQTVNKVYREAMGAIEMRRQRAA